MVLRKGDFALMKINWSTKARNIAELARDLDIGMDSIVFIDDNPAEREAIRTALPEVTVPEFPADTCELTSFLERVYKECFFTLESTRGGSQAHRGVPGLTLNAPPSARPPRRSRSSSAGYAPRSF